MDSVIFKSTLSLTGIVIITMIIQLYLDKITEQEDKKRLVEGFDGNPFSLIPMVFEVLIAAIQFLVEFPKRLDFLLSSLGLVGGGLFQELNAVGKNTPLLITEATKMATCAISRVSKFKSCFHWYIVDLIVAIIYTITVRFVVFVIYFITGGFFDLNPIVTNFWDLLEEIDVSLKPYLGKYHINHYPDYITTECYDCEPIDQSAVENAVSELGEPAVKLINGVITFLSVFTGKKPSLI